ncbi:MAG: tyrosine-type recombinase/integrase [Solirubrobacteraceae bacterium]|jgi:site-specific recombinase XerD
MSALAPSLESFFTSYLIGQRGASEHTITAYRDTMRLLLKYAHERTGIQPSDLDISVLDAELITAFLAMLEQQRGNSTRTRNARLAAIHSLYRHAALRHPEHADLIARVLAIPPKNHDQTTLTYLTAPEIDALLAAPDRRTPTGRRDHLIILLMITTGVRVSELTALTRADVHTGKPAAHIATHGKGRKTRITPLDTTTATAMRAWLNETPGSAASPVFTARGTTRKLTTDAVAQRLKLHATTAANAHPTIATKNLTPHILRHTCAMRMLAAGIDATTIALWLGHESPDSTRAYLHADLQLKQQALDRTAPPRTRRGRYRPPDKLLAFLEAL